MATASPTATPPIILPATGKARVKSVLSGDSVVLLGAPPKSPNLEPPEVIFSFEGISAPRLASKSTGSDEPGAFAAREWLRNLVIGKTVTFVTRKQGTGDRVYGWIIIEDDSNLAIECVKKGFGTPKAIKYAGNATTSNGTEKEETDSDDYENKLIKAYHEAVAAKVGIHADLPLVRNVKNAGEDFEVLTLVQNCQKLASQKRLTCVIEHVFDGGRMRCQVTDSQLPDLQYANFTLLLAGITCPRIGNPKADPPIPTEDLAVEARQFVLIRLLQRELNISLLGTDKFAVNAVGIVHHPVGNIAVELLKNGLARLTDWSVRLMPPAEVPALRVAENTAKRSFVKIWKNYAPPVLTNPSQIRGTVIEVLSGDTILLLPEGKNYDSEALLMKVSLASVRAPRVGSTQAGRADEPYSMECKDRMRSLTIGKVVSVQIHYERDIPIRPGENEKRPFGTVSVGKLADVSEVLISEGLAVTQQHRDDDEKSPRIDELRTAEAAAKDAKKGVHRKDECKPKTVNDLTDPRKAKAYSGALMRAKNTKAVVDFVFNGALFKLFVPVENCYIRFSPNYIRCPQPSPSPGSKTGKPAEPFGDEAKFHARLHVLQRPVEIVCTGVTNGGIVLGNMFVGSGNARRDYTIELLGAGFATVDQHKIDYNEAPKALVDAQAIAKANKVGLWSLVQDEKKVEVKAAEKCAEIVVNARLSEIRSGSHFFYHVINDEALVVMDASMKAFTSKNGTAGAPCDAKVGKVVAALFDDGTGKRWYRGKIVERKGPGKMTVLFVDYGNMATVPVATHLRLLDMSLGTDRIPPIAKEAVLALTITRAIDTDEGVDAARFLQSTCWDQDLIIRTLAPDENGKMAVTVTVAGSDETVNAQLVSQGLARAAKEADALAARMADGSPVLELLSELQKSEQEARNKRRNMWRYGDVGDEDPDDI